MRNLIFSESLLTMYNEAKSMSPENACARGDNLYLNKNYPESIPFYYSAAERNNSRGCLCMGNAFADGTGITQNYEEAYDWYIASTRCDNPEVFAYFNLGNLYENGLGVQKNLDLAEENYAMAAVKGHSEALERLHNIAYLYENGIGTEENLFRAAQIYEKAATMGKEESLGRFTRLVIVGEGVPDYYDNVDIVHSSYIAEKLYNNRLFPLALRHYMNLSLTNFSSDASYTAGNMIFRGIGRFSSPIEALCYYINAAENEPSGAMISIGKMLELGLSMPQDPDAALKFYHKSSDPCAGTMAEAVIKEVQSVGQDIEIKGDTIEECIAKAKEYQNNGRYYLAGCYYELAAEKGSADAAFNAALIYRTPEKWLDLKKATRYFEIAADAGSIPALLELGMMYEYGLHNYPDFNKAMECYCRAQNIINGLDRFNMNYIMYNDTIKKHISYLSVFMKYPDAYMQFLMQPIRCDVPAIKNRFFKLIDEDVEVNIVTDEDGYSVLDFNREPEFIKFNPQQLPDLNGVREENAQRNVPDNVDKYFSGVVGMNSVKEQLNKICNNIKIQKKRNEILTAKGITPPENSRRYNFIITGNTGTGKTLVARIIAKILYDIGIREKDTLVETDRSGLVGETIGSTPLITKGVIDKAKDGVLFIDEAYTLFKEDNERDFGQEAIDTLVKDMEDHGDTYSVIMAGYKEPLQNMIKNANTGLASRFTYAIDIPDYTDDELLEIAGEFIKAQHFEADESVFGAIRKCIIHDKIDETFGNARYIRELVNRAVDNMSDRIADSDKLSDNDYFSFRPEDFWQGGKDEKSTAEYLDELNELIGLSSVKKEVNEIINRIEIDAEMEKRGLATSGNIGTLHMTFKGNAGTGKTTVARLLGKLYSSLGVIKRNDVFVECSRADLVGMYQGHTAAMVKKVVHSALGGILFVDEAYSLVQGTGDTFGKEALDTLVALMENHRDNLIVIFAGYGDDIDKFLANNQGLKSRIPIELYFEDYSPEELTDIMRLMLKKRNLHLSETAEQAVHNAIITNYKQKDFGNARGVRNLVDSFIRQQNARIADLIHSGQQITDEMLTTIEAEDIISA